VRHQLPDHLSPVLPLRQHWPRPLLKS
jgi:hypothetical protein